MVIAKPKYSNEVGGQIDKVNRTSALLFLSGDSRNQQKLLRKNNGIQAQPPEQHSSLHRSTPMLCRVLSRASRKSSGPAASSTCAVQLRLPVQNPKEASDKILTKWWHRAPLPQQVSRLPPCPAAACKALYCFLLFCTSPKSLCTLHRFRAPTSHASEHTALAWQIRWSKRLPRASNCHVCWTSKSNSHELWPASMSMEHAIKSLFQYLSRTKGETYKIPLSLLHINGNPFSMLPKQRELPVLLNPDPFWAPPKKETGHTHHNPRASLPRISKAMKRDSSSWRVSGLKPRFCHLPAFAWEKSKVWPNSCNCWMISWSTILNQTAFDWPCWHKNMSKHSQVKHVLFSLSTLKTACLRTISNQSVQPVPPHLLLC